MSITILPPGRASISQRGFVNPCGPHHFATCAASVHSLNTSARGALNTRVSTTSFCSVATASFVVAMLVLLVLHFVQIFGQPVEPLVPALLERLDPVVDRLQAFAAQLVDPLLAVGADTDQPDFPQHAQMFRHLRLPDAQCLHDVVHRPLALRQERQDLAPLRFRNGIERIGSCRQSSHGRHHIPLSEYVKQKITPMNHTGDCFYRSDTCDKALDEEPVGPAPKLRGRNAALRVPAADSLLRSGCAAGHWSRASPSASGPRPRPPRWPLQTQLHWLSMAH